VSILNLLTMIGGLALFLYGMDLMGGSLTMLSGKRMQRILQNLTDNTWKGIFLGMTVTAIIQSSSSTTVVVVSLVNSGIMKLHSAVGVIMGANIGTTITAWILSLTGLTSSNLFVQLLKPTSFSPVIALVGVILIMSSKKEKQQMIGKILMGLAVLMFGMETMSTALKPLAREEGFVKLFLLFTNPLLGALAGAVLTAVIQSSSASIGILQALCITGIVPMSAAIPIILGQNIGTCVTALLAVIGAKRNARRAALIHLSFNVFGTVIFMTAFYAADAVFSFSFADKVATPFSIAIAHSVFNVANTLILQNFTVFLEKIAFFFIPETQSEKEEKLDEFSLLDERLLETPSIALQQAWSVSVSMLEKSAEALNKALGLLNEYDGESFENVRSLEQKVDKYQDQLGGYLIKVSGVPMTDKDNLRLSIIINSISDFERISDYALGIAMEARKLYESPMRFSPLAMEELGIYTHALEDILALTLNAYTNEDTELAKSIEPLEEVIDLLNEAIRIRHIERLRAGICSIEMGLLLTDVTAAMERVSDHCSNIAVALIEIHAGIYDAHRYLRAMKEKDAGFHAKMEEYLALYKLPPNDEAAEACVLAQP